MSYDWFHLELAVICECHMDVKIIHPYGWMILTDIRKKYRGKH